MRAIDTADTGAAPTELATLVNEQGRRVFRFALQLVGDRDEAMDITQEAFLRLHQHWSRRNPDRSAIAWLYKIVRNLATDLLRHRAVKARSAEHLSRPRPADGPEMLLERDELKLAVWRAIGKLPPPLREVVVLRDLHGLRYAEIAEVLGVPVSTVNNRLHDAREALRAELRPHLRATR